MAKRSAGLLLYRLKNGQPEVLLVHPGGPYWAKKDDGAWSILRDTEGEEPLAAARREFEERRASARKVRPSPLAQSANLAASSSRHLPWKATWTLPLSAATRSAWNGRRAPAGCKPFRRWTAPDGSGRKKRRGRFCGDNCPSCVRSGNAWLERADLRTKAPVRPPHFSASLIVNS